jgi:hypothetical protein
MLSDFLLFILVVCVVEGLILFILIGLLLREVNQQRQEKKHLEKFRQRQAGNGVSNLRPIREMTTLTLTLTKENKSRWGIPEYSLCSSSDPLVTYWVTHYGGLLGSSRLTAGELVEAETVEGRWVVTWNETGKWPRTPSYEIRLASSEIYAATLNYEFLKGYVLEFPNGRTFYWKPTVSTYRTGHRKWALTDEHGTHFVLCNEQERRVIIQPKAIALPELTLLTLMSGYLAMREFDYGFPASD